ncbi:MAG: hypothetical protein JSV49_04360 [Thermoplasmata archaeon]|nr:MAG: hypothetical protein JSV49_04360 [Thermoplasmata archaeon]
MLIRPIKTVLLIICIIGLFFLPMSDVYLHDSPMDSAFSDFMRVTSENVEHTDYHSSDISTFVNDHFVFYVPPPTVRSMERPSNWGGYTYKTSNGYIIANLSTIQLFSYENGAEIELEWLNGTAINGTRFNVYNECWELESYYTISWLDKFPKSSKLKKTVTLGEYETEEIQLNSWFVHRDYRILGGVIKITSDYPISVMHHKLNPMGTLDDNGYEMINYRWEGVYSAYGKKIFTRITGDCWISALEADTTVNVWDYSDKNDDTKLSLDRFEGWAYTRNPIFEQYGFDDDLVLISADKPISIVAGVQSEQGFVQVFGKDGKDFLFPCFGKILIHAPTGASIDLKDKNGNQGTYKGSLARNEMKLIDFKVAYKLDDYSSYEWAQLRASEPIIVYTFANTSWTLNVEDLGKMSGEEYVNVYKKTTKYYSHGWEPYPAATEFKLPIRSRAYITVVNLDEGDNDVEIDFSGLYMPYETEMEPNQAVTLEYSENSYYYMHMVVRDTDYKQPPQWTYKDPHNHYAINAIPRIAVDEGDSTIINLEYQNITKGSTVKIKSTYPVLVFINYNKDEWWQPQGIDLIPGLTPPIKRGLPELPTMIVTISGILIAADAIMIAVGRRSIVEVL